MPSIDALTDLILNSGPFKCRVVHCRRQRYDVYIGRPSKWGNPFKIGRDGNRQVVIQKYRQYLTEHPELVAAAKIELVDKVLGCHCAPKDCHGHVLAEIVNGHPGR